MNETMTRPAGLRGLVSIPGDKSISHRALLLNALADGPAEVGNFLPSGDCQATIACLNTLGVRVDHHDETTLTVRGVGLRGLAAPSTPLNCARSGTTMRLLAGLLAAQSFDSVLTGDPQLLRRPMRRVTKPLREMDAAIEDDDGRAPLRIHGQEVLGRRHVLPVASAQVKSALLLAGLYASGPTTVVQPGPSRDHTERMLAAMGAHVRIQELTVTLQPVDVLHPLSLTVPGDFSSAAFLLAAAVTVPGAQLTMRGVGINPTRTGLLDVLQAMGADITLRNLRFPGDEPVADLMVHQAPLRGTQVGGDTVVRMIDEFPALAVVATQAEGETVVRDAAELRVKETDRIATVVTELTRMGADIEARPDGFLVRGPTPLHGTTVESHGDHRLAMALAVAGLLAEGETVIQDAECAADSFPGFWPLLRGVLLT